MPEAGEPLRIIHCFRCPTGGVLRHIRDLVNAQIAAGHEVGVICDLNHADSHHESQLKLFTEKLPLGLHRIHMSRSLSISDLPATFSTWKILNKINPDVVHCHTAKGGVFGRVASKALIWRGKPTRIFYAPHGGSLHFDSKSLKGRIFFAAEKILERLTHKTLFVCEYEKKIYIEKIGHPKHGHQVIYNGLHPYEYNQIDICENAADFLFIGMMRDLKGADIFVEAMERLHSLGHIDLTAIMVGEGQDIEKYKSQVVQAGLSDHIEFLPSMDSQAAFKLAKIVVVPSRAESLPYIVLETIAAQKPIIATKVGGIPEIITQSDQNCLVPPANSVALAQTMLNQINTPTSKNKLLKRAEELQKKFSASKMVSTIEDAYRQSAP